MKKTALLRNYLVLIGLAAFGLASCKKNDTLGYTPGTGAPAITSVRTLGKALTDSTTKIYTTISSTGTTYDTVKNAPAGYTPQDSTTATGNLNNTYELIGKNLGTTTKIVINGTSIYFNRALGSDSQVIFTISSSVPTIQPQPNTIVLTTLYGTVTYKFTVLPPAPTVTAYSTNDFFAGSQITLTGHGFTAVTSVTLKTTKDAATIVSQNDSVIVLKMPHSAATESPLLFTYTAGSNTGLTTFTSNYFNDLDNAYMVFDDNLENGWYNASWGPASVSTAQFKTGTSSFAVTYPKGNFWVGGFGTGGTGLPTANYTYLAFWIKGGVEAETLYLTADTRPGGYGNSDQGYPITVPAGVWTYFKLPLSALSLQGSKNFGFWIPGPTDEDETLYYDDVALIK